jgi:hypothetical protein
MRRGIPIAGAGGKTGAAWYECQGGQIGPLQCETVAESCPDLYLSVSAIRMHQKDIPGCDTRV